MANITIGSPDWMPKHEETCVGCGKTTPILNEDGLCVDCKIDAEDNTEDNE